MTIHKLDDIIELKYGKSLPKRKRIPGEIPVYGSGGIVGTHCEALVKGPGIIVGRKGSIGTVYYEERDFFPIDTVFYVAPKHEDLDLYYFSVLLEVLELSKLNSDSAVPGLNRNIALSQKVDVVPYLIQRKISSILKGCRDSINNSNIRIRILEDLAQNIYRQWFVKFSFPGCENLGFSESEDGRIPDCWEFKPLIECCDLIMGQSPKSEYYNKSGEGMPFHQGVSDFGFRYPSHNNFCTISKRVALQGDILFSVRAPVGRINVAHTDLIIGRGLSAIRHKKGSQVFLFHQLKHLFAEEDTIGGGSIYKSVTKNDMSKIKLLIPPTNIIENFEEITSPMSKKIALETKKVQTLETIFCLLKMKLISGEIDVSGRDIEVDE